MPRSQGRRRTGNLPAEITSFVGRTRELFEVRRALADERLVTLVGVGGVGKTRLAIRSGEELGRAFPGGVWIVELAGLATGANVANAVAAATGLALDGTEPTARSLAKQLDDRNVLLILDNCEHLLAGCIDFVSEFIRNNASARILATSRQPFGMLGEYVLEVKPLSLPDSPSNLSPKTIENYDAIQLFAERASSAVPDFAVSRSTATTVAEVCQRLDGIPLAIELAAIRLRALTLHELLSRLDDQHQLLNLGSRVPQPRQRSLNALNDWTYALCSEQEREFWTRLSVFADRFDLTAAASICAGDGITQSEIFDLTAGLVEKSVIVRVDEGVEVHYQLMDTIRQYGDAILKSGGQYETYKQRHADHFSHVAERLLSELRDGGAARIHATLRRDHGNLAETVEYLMMRPSDNAALLRVSTLLCLCPGNLGVFGKEIQRLREVLQTSVDPSSSRANALWVESMCALAAGNATEAESAIDECERMAKVLGDQSVMPYVSECRGLLTAASGDVSAAVRHLTLAFLAHGKAADQFGLQQSCRHLLAIAWLAEDFDAVQQVKDDISGSDTVVGPRWRPQWAFAAGLESLRHADPDKATALFGEALLALQHSGDFRLMALCFDGLVQSAWAQKNYVKAARLLGFVRMIRSALGVRESYAGGTLDPRGACADDLRQRLGDVQFDVVTDLGGELTYSDAVEYALELHQDGHAVSISVEDSTLTPREREVAELVCRGLTNQAIGEALTISKRTIESHIEHIMTKLGFTRRTQIATWYTKEHPGMADPTAPY